MKNNIDLRAEFDEFVNDYGYDVLLHRSNKKIRCRCWNEKHQEADSRCPICTGVGWIGRIERHKLTKQSATQIISRPNLNQLTPIGRQWIDAQTLYMRHDSHPQVGDYIYEVGWNQNRPSHLVTAYRINDVTVMRGDNGRVEYTMVSVKSENLDKKFRNIVVRSIGPIKNYEIVN